MRCERMRGRAEAAARHPAEPESDDVPDEEWLEDESPLKKLLRDDDPPRAAMAAAG